MRDKGGWRGAGGLCREGEQKGSADWGDERREKDEKGKEKGEGPEMTSWDDAL